jgi:hypothetical protein
MEAKKNIFITVVVLLSLISGCTVLSFYPLYTEDVLIRNDKIIGKWETIEGFGGFGKSDTLVWEITFNDEKWIKKHNIPFDRGSRTEPNKFAYSLFLYYTANPEKQTEFQLHILELDGKTYIDFFPENWEPDNTILGFHLMGVHTFAKVNIENDSIVIHWFDAEWFANKLENNKIRIKHEKNSANILLTAQPKELQKFVSKYSNDKDAFDEDFTFTLKPQI